MLAVPQFNALACPDCNIHNFLVTSVGCSKNIIVGRLKEALEDRKVRVEVLRTIRGTYQKGDVVIMEGPYEASKQCGECFVFSDPENMGPTFAALPASFEDEVRFLTGYEAGELGCDVLDSCYSQN